ncbi:hypothetical protein PN419_17070 [Halorubrum ezzemoulense]|uniref:hypothetical protein n=1 Tax=Halorubrum ezzemoulense TaxID=337243 RepID=UPI00232BE76B|nr:hypothetical protein [Halorubrum ezzemoulense]MDB9250690.1 hypothetical protein [Halorubrum ezzemoulense]MDB9260805.1 hypothetical protein [Halorubrum ezzemoulense]MDB9264226.1 hypothetical protein [Halorubrum ezzemoulense]MDB9267698.1 hypothetical protein [Halorubrum ezzemoulense]MDB9271166.1 hypothetical protein [Halorubrum ezzemoulense]
MGGPNGTVRLFCGEQPSVRDGVDSDRVVSVLFGTDVERWRSGWDRARARPPDREAVVDVTDIARSGTAASTQVVPNNGLAYTVLGRTVESERVFDAVADHFDGVPDGAIDVVVDDLAPVAAREGVDSAVAFVDRLLERFVGRVGRISMGCSFEIPVELLSRVGARADVVVGPDAEAVTAVERLSREDPTTFGYVRRHWVEAKRGIETCDRNYPQSKQVHAALADPETTPRTLGATLSGMVTLGALETWGDTVGPTRYDLTAYRPKRTWALGAAIATGVSDD